jgi:hypothetical protein
VASRLGLSVETVQKWAEEYASERKKLPSAQAENQLASLQAEIASMERQVQQRLVEALLNSSAQGGSSSSSEGPYAIAVPHFFPVNAGPDGTVTPVNLASNAGTSPAYFGSIASNCVILWTCWIQWLTMVVVGRDGKPITPNYNGTEVYEFDGGSWKPINQTIGPGNYKGKPIPGGTYQDPVFAYLFNTGDQTSAPPQYNMTTQASTINDWTNPSVTPPQAMGDAAIRYRQNIRVSLLNRGSPVL